MQTLSWEKTFEIGVYFKVFEKLTYRLYYKKKHRHLDIGSEIKSLVIQLFLP